MNPTDLSRFYLVLANVPKGRVITYGELAAQAGLAGRARWAGKMLHDLPPDSNLPWHRIINAQGRLSFPFHSPRWQRQAELLRQEGIELSTSGRIDLRRFGLIAPHEAAPLPKD